MHSTHLRLEKSDMSEIILYVVVGIFLLAMVIYVVYPVLKDDSKKIEKKEDFNTNSDSEEHKD